MFFFPLDEPPRTMDVKVPNTTPHSHTNPHEKTHKQIKKKKLIINTNYYSLTFVNSLKMVNTTKLSEYELPRLLKLTLSGFFPTMVAPQMTPVVKQYCTTGRELNVLFNVNSTGIALLFRNGVMIC